MIFTTPFILVLQCHPDIHFDKSGDWDWSKTADPAMLNYQRNLTQVLTAPFLIHILLFYSRTSYSSSTFTDYLLLVFFASCSSSHWLLIFSVVPGLALNFFLVSIHSHDNFIPWIWISSILTGLSFLVSPEYCCCLVAKSCPTL